MAAPIGCCGSGRKFLACPQSNKSLGRMPMDTSRQDISGRAVAAPSRRQMIKGALAAGIAAPAVLRITPAFAAYPERPVRIIVANTPGGPSDIIARIMAAAMQQAIGGTVLRREPRRRRRQYRHGARRALRSRRLHHPADDQRLFGQSRALQHAALRSVQGFRRRSASLRSRRMCSRSAPASVRRR